MVLRTPKRLHGTMAVAGAVGAGDFLLVLRQGVNFCFHCMGLYSKCSDFSGDFKYAKDKLNNVLPKFSSCTQDIAAWPSVFCIWVWNRGPRRKYTLTCPDHRTFVAQ